MGSVECSVLTEEAEEDTVLLLSLSCCGESGGGEGGQDEWRERERERKRKRERERERERGRKEGDEETCRDMIGNEMKVQTNKSKINKKACHG